MGGQHTQPIGSFDRVSRFRIWKDQHVPLLYDWLSSRKLVWPHEALRWGSLSHEQNRARAMTGPNTHVTRSLFLAERTGSTTRDPNTLLQFDVKVVQELTNKPNDIAKPWHEEAILSERADQVSTKDFWLRKRIIHPGEVNRIRVAGPNLVVTRTDAPELFVWDFATQPDRKKDETEPSTPSCSLIGHAKSIGTAYAMDVTGGSLVSDQRHDICVVSGGLDCNVLLWRLADYQSTGQRINASVRMEAAKNGDPTTGHLKVIEDVSFNANNKTAIVSVGQDGNMMVWDTRNTAKPSALVLNAHPGDDNKPTDINCCDWAGTDGNKIVTGGNDKTIRLWDRRLMLDMRGRVKPVKVMKGHTDQVNHIAWNRYVPGVFASGGEDGNVLIWNLHAEYQRPGSGVYQTSHELMFKHVGHAISPAKIVDLEWQPSESDPYCLASLSTADEGGSTLQMWRMSDLIYRPKDEVAADLRQHARSRLL